MIAKRQPAETETAQDAPLELAVVDRRPRTDLIDIVEAAYDPSGTDAEWLARLLATVAPDLGPRTSVGGFFYDLGSPRPERFWSPTAASHRPEEVASVYETKRAMPMSALRYLFYGTPTCITGREQTFASEYLPAEVVDLIAVRAGDPAGRGCVMGTHLHEPRRTTRRERYVWCRAAAHVAAGLRLRWARDPAADVEAVLDPGGKVHDASSEAAKRRTEELSRAVRCRERARSSRFRRAGPEEALDLWQGLVAGRWSLVDEIESDGRRYVVARHNPPATRGWERLSERERLVLAYAATGEGNKQIGYILGLAPSTVARHLSNAAAKLGLAGRAALISAYRASALR